MQGVTRLQQPQHSGATSRPYQIELRCPSFKIYSGEIIEFTAEFCELRFKQSRKQKLDIKVVSLRDPRLLAIYGDPKGGPGTIIMLENDVVFNPNNILIGYLQAGPNGLARVQRQNDAPVFINPAYMSIVNEDVSAASFPHAKGKAAGPIGPKAVFGKVAPKFMPRPPAGSPAAKAADSDWS